MDNKTSALAYLKSNGVLGLVERMLNDLGRTAPPDSAVFMVSLRPLSLLVIHSSQNSLTTQTKYLLALQPAPVVSRVCPRTHTITL